MPEIAFDVEKVSVYTSNLVGPFCSLLSMLLINNLYFFLSLSLLPNGVFSFTPEPAKSSTSEALLADEVTS